MYIHMALRVVAKAPQWQGYPGNASFPVYPWKPTQTPISPINKPFRIPG